MTQRPARLWGAAAVLTLVPLAGCGHGHSYCDAVRDHQSDLGSIARAPTGSDRAGLLQALPIFEDLQAKSPDDVTDDWQVLVTRLRALHAALDRAGVDPTTYDPKHPPAGLSAEDRVLIRRAAAELAASDTQQALDTVQQEVLDVCHTPLDL
jgi:hypothetical protein